MHTPRLLACLVLFATALCAQNRPPARPRLPADADTNDAAAYFQLGLDQLVQRPARAADAFYWAERLDPVSAQIPYARHVALLLGNRSRLAEYLERDPRWRRDREAVLSDSLMLLAVTRDPFVHRGLEEPLLVAYVGHVVHQNRSAGSDEEFTDAQIAYYLDTTLAETNLYARGLLAYSRSRFPEALRYWGLALRRARDPAFIHIERARAFFQMEAWDSARVAAESALAISRRSRDTAGVYGYERLAVWEYSLGRILEAQHADSAAVAAYRQSIVDDIAFYPSHLRLGMMALARRDTAQAVREFSSAAVTNDRDYFAQAGMGLVLQSIGRDADAVDYLERATADEPWAAAGWLGLARSLDRLHRRDDAVQGYTRYLALAPRGDVYRAAVGQRLAALRMPQ